MTNIKEIHSLLTNTEKFVSFETSSLLRKFLNGKEDFDLEFHKGFSKNDYIIDPGIINDVTFSVICVNPEWPALGVTISVREEDNSIAFYVISKSKENNYWISHNLTIFNVNDVLYMIKNFIPFK